TWKSLGLWDLLEQHVLTANGIVDLFLTFAPQMSHVRRGMWCTTKRSLWKSRNLKLWDEVLTTIYQRATTFLNQWQWTHLNDAQVARPTHVKRKRPPLGKVECNVDADFCDDKVDIGMCIRDHNGNFVWAKTVLLYLA
ncbi:cytochrome P450, partial [Trifolium medium]|nr:cytochrome P450 [Trifolium medium]